MAIEPVTQAETSAVRILVVDDERSMRELLDIALKREGYNVLLAENGTAALAQLERQPVDLLISDIKMPDMSGVEVLRVAKGLNQDTIAIMITAFASTESAAEALQMGAYDYVSKPFSVDELKIVVRNALEHRQLPHDTVPSKNFSNIIGRSEPIQAMFRLIEKIARTNSTILVTGESGTGKELVARAIHFNSLRRDRPFVALNCGALPETLLESELFGHVRGAFTGAAANKKGLIEVAEKGTIFLDEISEMSPLMQVKLLRVLQERRFRHVGGTEEVRADIRIIAATNRDLARLVGEGRFREDLFYRINVISVHLPALRERLEDIPLLADHFVTKFSEQMGKQITGTSSGAQWALRAYGWPGNVRELENVLERAVALERTPKVQAESLQLGTAGRGETPSPGLTRGTATEAETATAGASRTEPLPENGFDLERHVQQIEREYIGEALRRAGGVKVKAAELLGMSFRSFRYYMKKYNVG